MHFFFFKFIIENVVFCCSSSHPQAVSYANTAQVLLFCIPSPVIKVFQPSSAPTSTCTDLFLANRKCAKNNRSSHPSLGSNFLGKVVDNLLLSVVFWFLVCLCLVVFFFFFPNITWRKNSCHEKIYLPYLQFLLKKNILYIADSLLFSSSVNSWHLLSCAWNINSPVQTIRSFFIPPTDITVKARTIRKKATIFFLGGRNVLDCLAD